jgi:hypothetical protein
VSRRHPKGMGVTWTAGQRVSSPHAIGDNVLQSDWMAPGKTDRWLPAIAHGLTYALPFVYATRRRLVEYCCVSHMVIDRYRLARYACWPKNNITPRVLNPPWRECMMTGFSDTRPR